MKLCSCGCNKEARKGGTLSAACYMRAYRQTESGKTASNKANRAWEKRHREQYLNWRRGRYREKYGIPEELRETRQALKRLEEALAQA